MSWPYCTKRTSCAECGTVNGIAAGIRLTGDKTPWYTLGEKHELPLSAFDALLMRKDPPFDMEYVYSTYLLELAELQGARVINRPRALRDYNEKFSITRFIQLTVPTLVTRLEHEIRGFLDEQADIVLKPLDGMGGASVFRLHRQDPNIGVVIETLTHYGRRTIMAQRYIPEIVKGDKRIILIDGEPVPYALARIPKPGETRGNLAAGGRGVAQELSLRDRAIAEAVGPALAAEGMAAGGARRHRRLPHRNQHNQPNRHARDHGPDRVRRSRNDDRRSGKNRESWFVTRGS